MPRQLTSKSSLDNLKREAKRWLRDLRANVADARARLDRALTNVPALPTLRDVQHALAREYVFVSSELPPFVILRERAERVSVRIYSAGLVGSLITRKVE